MEMMIHLVGLQEDVGLGVEASDDVMVTQRSRSFGHHYALLRELVNISLAKTRFDIVVGENGYR